MRRLQAAISSVSGSLRKTNEKGRPGGNVIGVWVMRRLVPAGGMIIRGVLSVGMLRRRPEDRA
jgi:hypothetical protein